MLFEKIEILNNRILYEKKLLFSIHVKNLMH